MRDIPGVVTILDWHETEDTFYIVMERYRGQDLFDYISSQGSLAEPLSRNVFSKVRFSVQFRQLEFRTISRYWRPLSPVTRRESCTATSRTRTSSSTPALEPSLSLTSGRVFYYRARITVNSTGPGSTHHPSG